jgi:hypothetical protein
MEELESVARPLNLPGSQRFMEGPNRHGSWSVGNVEKSFIFLARAVASPASALEPFRDLQPLQW